MPRDESYRLSHHGLIDERRGHERVVDARSVLLKIETALEAVEDREARRAARRERLARSNAQKLHELSQGRVQL
jgi:hypothetical protein